MRRDRYVSPICEAAPTPYSKRLALLLTLALASQEEVDGGKKFCGFAHALLSPVMFCVEPGVVVGEKTVVLFFGKDLRQPDRKFSRLDQVAAE